MTLRLQDEIQQARPFRSLREEALLSLWRTAAVTHDRLELMLREHGISRPQYNVLRILRGAGPSGRGRNEIRDRLVARMPDVTRLLDRLEEMQLVQRSRGTDDRRVVTTTITDAGSTLLAQLDPLVVGHEEQQLQHLSDDDLRTLIDLLARARAAD